MARYAISDIHGCLKTFQALLGQFHFSASDELFLLGDYVNKGPDSKGVLEYLMQLQSENYQLTILRGNHDQLLLDAAEANNPNIWLSSADQQLTLQSFGIDSLKKMPLNYLNFIRQMPLYHVLPDFIMVHAGLHLSSKDLFDDPYILLNAKHQLIKEQRLGGKRLIHGHLPVGLTKIKKAIKKRKSEINLDAGCVYYKNQAFGKLVAINLDSFQLYIQSNLDQPYPINLKK